MIPVSDSHDISQLTQAVTTLQQTVDARLADDPGAGDFDERAVGASSDEPRRTNTNAQQDENEKQVPHGAQL